MLGFASYKLPYKLCCLFSSSFCFSFRFSL